MADTGKSLANSNGCCVLRYTKRARIADIWLKRLSVLESAFFKCWLWVLTSAFCFFTFCTPTVIRPTNPAANAPIIGDAISFANQMMLLCLSLSVTNIYVVHFCQILAFKNWPRMLEPEGTPRMGLSGALGTWSRGTLGFRPNRFRQTAYTTAVEY